MTFLVCNVFILAVFDVRHCLMAVPGTYPTYTPTTISSRFDGLPITATIQKSFGTTPSTTDER